MVSVLFKALAFSLLICFPAACTTPSTPADTSAHHPANPGLSFPLPAPPDTLAISEPVLFQEHEPGMSHGDHGSPAAGSHRGEHRSPMEPSSEGPLEKQQESVPGHMHHEH